MDLSHARTAALILVTAAVTSLSLATGLSSPAAAARRAAPSVSVRTVGLEQVSVAGRTATESPRVRFHRSTGSGWVLVKRARAHRHHYTTTLTAAAGSAATFRATANGRSRTFVVRMPAARKPPPATQYDACGARPLKPDGSAWSCTFDDEFSGTALDRTKWLPQTVFTSGSASAFACYGNDPSTVNVADGSLNLSVRRTATPVSCQVNGQQASTNYLAGMVSTYRLFSQQYGRFEARIRTTATTAPGLQETFWLWPDDRVASTALWPYAGEIDVSETYSSYPNLSIPFLHYAADAGGPHPGLNTAWDCAAARGQWNTYTLVWSATRLEILVNGRTCLVNTSGDPAFQKPYIAAFTQALGTTGNEYDGRAPIPATMNVDYLRVWR